MIDTYLQMIVALAVVVGMILALNFGLRKRQTKPGLMNIISYQSFGPRKGLAALKIGTSVLLLGITSTDIRLLKTFNENDLEAEATSEVNDKLRMLRDMKERLHERK